MSHDSDFESNNNQNKQLTAEQRLERIENAVLSQSQFVQSTNYYGDDGDEIDLKELFSVIWAGKLKIILITAIFSIAAVLYALSLSNQYKATTVLAPTNQEKESSLGNLASQYGGLAAMAGINLGSASGENKVDHALKLLRSWPYIEKFIQKFELKPLFLATTGWDELNNSMIYDKELYDSTSNKWLSDKNISLEPSSYDTYERFMESISIGIEKETGLINLSVTHYSPYIARDVVNLLTKELNDYFKAEDRLEAQRGIELLLKKIESTRNNDMQQIFYRMVEQHSQTLLMTEVNEEYLIKTLVPVMLPERKSGPKRTIICALGFLIGFVLSIFLVLIRHYIKINKVKER